MQIFEITQADEGILQGISNFGKEMGKQLAHATLDKAGVPQGKAYREKPTAGGATATTPQATNAQTTTQPTATPGSNAVGQMANQLGGASSAPTTSTSSTGGTISTAPGVTTHTASPTNPNQPVPAAATAPKPTAGGAPANLGAMAPPNQGYSQVTTAPVKFNTPATATNPTAPATTTPVTAPGITPTASTASPGIVNPAAPKPAAKTPTAPANIKADMEKYFQDKRNANQAKNAPATGKIKSAAGLPTPADQARFDELVKQAIAAQGQAA